MRSNSALRSLGSALALAVTLVACASAQESSAETSAYGTFTNMHVSGGEYSGFELTLLPSNEGDFVLVQQAEGWPGRPVLLPARLGGTTVREHNVLRFEHPELGPFRGAILGDSLVGEFTTLQYRVALRRGSVWQ